MSVAAAQIQGTERPWLAEVRATATLAWPLILTNLVQTAFTTIDVIMLGWLGPQSLAAGALATNVYFAFLIFGLGLVTAISPMLASELGRRRHSVRDVRRTVRQGLWTAVTVTVPLWFVLWHGEAILLALHQDPVLAHQAARYLHTLQWAILPFLCYIVLRSFVAAQERPLWGLGIGILAFFINAATAYTLIFGRFGMPALGLVGAGIATSISATIMFAGLALVLLVDRRFRRYRLFGRFWRADWHRFRAIWRLGLPMAAMLVFEITTFNAAVFLMGLIGADSLAAHSIAIQIASVAFMVPMGFGQAATVRVGRAHGAGEHNGIARAGWVAFALGVGFMAVTATAMLVFPRSLIGVFLDLKDPANARVVEIAIVFLSFAALFQVADGAQAVAIGMLRGLQDARVPMLFAAFGYWCVGLPLGAWLAFRAGMQGAGVWMGIVVGLAVVAVLMTSRWVMRARLGLLPAPRSAPQAVASVVT